MTDFDMPATGTWEQRGGWVANALAKEFLLTKEQAAGITGNLGFESAAFTKLQEMAPVVPGSRGGAGWAQWTGGRRHAFEAWCAKAGVGWQSDAANYGFLSFELHGAYAYCIRDLRQELTLGRCVFVFGRLFEAPGGTTETHLPGFEGRLAYAQRALAGAKIAGVAAPVAVPAPSVPIPSAREMQTTLAALGFYHDAIDGDFGPRSQAALAAYLRQK